MRFEDVNRQTPRDAPVSRTSLLPSTRCQGGRKPFKIRACRELPYIFPAGFALRDCLRILLLIAKKRAEIKSFLLGFAQFFIFCDDALPMAFPRGTDRTRTPPGCTPGPGSVLTGQTREADQGGKKGEGDSYFAKCVSNSSLERFAPSSVRITDFVFPRGFAM